MNGKRTLTAKFGRYLMPLVLTGTIVLSACGSGNDSKSSGRPATTAKLRIVEPTAGAIVGRDVLIKLDLAGGTIVPQATTKLVPNGGHIHTYLDGKLVSMTEGLDVTMPGLEPGPHNFRAEFVAADHAPFRERVTAAAIFEVRQ